MVGKDVSNTLVFFVNGRKVVDENPDPKLSLLRYLREKLRLTGSKNGCSEGGCGACTVMASRFDPNTNVIVNSAINSCLTPVCSLHGMAIVTVEGLGSVKGGLHPIQERIAKSHGSQCGFCTPGFVMSAYALLRNNPNPTEEDLEKAFHGNLCRCTGYRPILEGLKTFCGAQNCCRNQNNGNTVNGVEENGETKERKNQNLIDPLEFRSYDPTQDPIFPPELKLNLRDYQKTLQFSRNGATWFRPETLEDLIDLKYRFPSAKLVGGHTAVAEQPIDTFIHVSPEISELCGIREDGKQFVIGSRTTFVQLQNYCSDKLKSQNAGSTTLYSAILKLFSRIGDVQTRNVATIGGCAVSGSNTSDSNPFFGACGASVTLRSKRGERVVTIDNKFYKVGGGANILADEVITDLRISLPSTNEFIWTTKQATRRDVCASDFHFSARCSIQNNEIQQIRIVVGGLAMKNITFAKNLDRFLLGKSVSVNSFLKSFPTTIEGQVEVDRSTLAGVLSQFHQALTEWQAGLPPKSEPFIPIKSTQLFQITPVDQPLHDLVGRPMVHLSALKQATGEAIYVDDMSPTVDELYGEFLLSTKATGKIKSRNYDKALALPGVRGIFDARDIPGNVHAHFFLHDEVIFVEEEISFHAQALAFVVAETKEIAAEGASLVEIEYEEGPPPILTIEDAIAKNSFISHQNVSRGDVEAGFKGSDHVLEGEFKVGGQKHFYMEPNSCITYPKEDEVVEIHFTTQAGSHAQEVVAHALHMASSKVIVKNKRLGGGFGGKEVRANFIAVGTSVAALTLQKPVRATLSRQHDMLTVGGRHPMVCRYKVGFNKDGKINAVEAKVYALAGCTMDVSPFVTEAALRTIANLYNIQHLKMDGYPCKTNTQSNTAFRGFGAPQGTMIVEDVMDAVSEYLGILPEKVREQHFYRDGDVTPLGQTIERSTIQRCWDECMENSKFHFRSEALKKFNESSEYLKRGITILPVTFLVGFPFPTMNRGGSLVMIYKDGTVSLNHGGVEMGQGLHTKMMQVASRALGIPISKIHHADTSTDKVPNASTSAGSMTADLNGPAIVNACDILLERLKPYKDANPEGTWEDWVNAAFVERVNLSVAGYNKYDFEGACNYMVYGVACTEVEVNGITGEHQVLRTDIVMDVGESLNPAIDIGQIEGAFVQGAGWVTLEEVNFDSTGEILAMGSATYKVPTVSYVPRELNVSLLRGAPNPRAVYSSKAIGEPPLLLTSTVFFAIKNAVRACRENKKSAFVFHAPATVSCIREACAFFE